MNASGQKRRYLLLLDGLLLTITGLVQALSDVASYFFGLGPLGGRLHDNPASLGFFEAHILALILGVVILLGRHDAKPLRWYAAAAVCHLVLASANLLYWDAFVAFDFQRVGTVVTVVHGALFLAMTVAALSLRPQLVVGQGATFRWAALITLAAGLLLHGSSLALGREAFIATIFTPKVDLLLAVPMVVATFTGWRMLRSALHPHLWGKALHVLLLVYFTISIPVHLQTLIRGDTRYVLGFPEWYSVPILGLLSAFAAFILSLRFDTSKPRHA
ncbi:hypothetical protein [Deinococcus yavapaiensis]|uniref:Uncharacterized protein n=1 Tax=Deinococcus yavapaiensis KR-236 TaxID=694435 RepID=A0A318SII6_9DEIO|nr:hypothetical protein [Deinococcus yavapaiensis]PYE53877.1 hypothetical protein DES52_107135 [Deinococcus yavapaiensis KR-236]